MTTHTTKEGETLLIAQMEDSHLLATINLFCKNFEAARLVLKGNSQPFAGESVLNALNPEFSKDRVLDAARSAIRAYSSKLPDYICEAAIRGLDIAAPLQSAYGRKAKSPSQVNEAIALFLGTVKPKKQEESILQEVFRTKILDEFKDDDWESEDDY
jgi:hypothetical protein